MKKPPTFGDTSLDRIRMAENERLEAYMRANPWPPRGELVKAPPPPMDAATTAINARMQDEQRQILASRRQQVAQVQSFGEPWQIDPNNRPSSPKSNAYAPTQDEEINKRQAVLAGQYTWPYQPTQGLVPYQRLEQTADYMSPRAHGDPHVQRVQALEHGYTPEPPEAA
jgi:hypothetical protein